MAPPESHSPSSFTAEQAEALAQVAAIVENSDDAIIGKTLDGVIRSWNRGAERLFGYAAEEAIGKPITIIVPPELLDDERRILAILRRGERIEHYETTRLTKDRRRVHISLTVSPVRDEAGTIIGASKIARDITDRKRAETLLREAHADLQSRIAELARFNAAAVDRESRILALKREVNELRARLGEAGPYSFDGAEKENRPPALAYSRDPAPGESNRPTEGIASLESILITEQLQRRISRPADREAESRALGALVQALADASRYDPAASGRDGRRAPRYRLGRSQPAREGQSAILLGSRRRCVVGAPRRGRAARFRAVG